MLPSGPQQAFQFVLRPFDHFVDRLITLTNLCDYDRVKRLIIDLGRDIRPRRISGDGWLLVAARRIVVDRAGRRFDLLPRVEVVVALERRQIVSRGSRYELPGLLFLRQEQQQVLGRLLVLREGPDTVEERQLTDEAARRAPRHIMSPALGCDLRVVALGDCPGARRVLDGSAFAGDEPAVIAGVIPGVDFRRNERHQLLEKFECRARPIGIDLEVVLLVHHDRAKGTEHGAGGIDCVAGLAHGQTDREARREQLLGALEIEIVIPAIDQLGVALVIRREYGRQIDAAVLLVEIHARAARFDLTADRRRNAEPLAVVFGEIFGYRADRAGLSDERLDNLIDRLEHVAVDLDL